MTPEEKMLGTRSHREFLEQGKMDVVDEIFSPDCVIYNRHIPPEMQHGPTGFKAYGTMLRNGFSDFQIIHDDIITEGDKQAIRWTFHGTHKGELLGVPPTGKRVTISGFDIFIVADGKIKELWLEQDFVGMLQQIGAMPSLPGQAGG